MALVRVARLSLSSSSLSPRLSWLSSSSSFSSSAAAGDSAPPVVADRVVEVVAIDPDGGRHRIYGLAGRSLFQALVRNGLETERRHPLEELPSCNGNCEVTIANEWLERLSPRTEAEEERLRQLSTSGKVSKNSRLGCQLLLNKDLEGLTVAMVEERPWHTL